MRKMAKRVVDALKAPEARPAELALARIILGALGLTELAHALETLGAL
jgi:hypothetical protein